MSVELRLSNLDPLLGMAFDFNAVKPMIRAIASELDERVLIPSQSQYLVVKKKGDRIHATHAGRAYDLPQSDVRLLEVVNITSEELARYFAQKLQEKISEHKETAARITSLTVGIEETRGQSVFFDLSLSGML